MIKNIIFDIGNVLAGFVWEEFYESFGFSPEVVRRLGDATVRSPLWYEMDQGIMTLEEIIRGFKESDPSIAEEIDRIFSDLGGILVKYDYALGWIEELKKKGYGVYIISNIADKVVKDCRHALTFLDAVDGAVLSYQERVQKPDPGIYQILLKRYNLKPEECLFLDDLEKNIRAAEEQGIQGICFKTYEQAREELQAAVEG